MEKNIFNFRQSDGSIITFEVHKRLRSTADLAKEYALKGYPDRYVVFTDKLITSDNKEDENPSKESGLYMSCLLRPSFFPSQAPLLGAMSAAALISGLEEHTDKRLGLGWVGNVYCEGASIGGVTVEGKLDDYTTYEYVIITFAVKLDKKNFPPKLTDLIREVFESENVSIPMIIARTVLKKFFQYYPNLKNPDKFMDVYNSKFILKGKRIKYDYNQTKRSCKVVGINAKTGALIVNLGRNSEHQITSPSQVTLPKRIPLRKED